MEALVESMENPVCSLQDAMLILQSPTSEMDMKMASLRYLRQFVTEETNQIDTRLRASINQVVLDNVLTIVLSEDRVTDLRRRQLLRTECFLILGSLLGSNTLFGGIHDKLDQIENNNEMLREEKGLIEYEDQEMEEILEMSDHEIDAMMAAGDSIDETKDNHSVDRNLHVGEAISGPMTPSKKRRVVLKNPIHDSPSRGHAIGVKKMSKSDGFKEQKTPEGSSSTAAGKVVGKSKASGHANLKDSSSTRPPMGPPGGWVREEKSLEGSPSQHGTPLGRVGSPLQREQLPSPAPRNLFSEEDVASTSTSQLSGMSNAPINDLSYSRSTGDLSVIGPTLRKPPRKLKLPKSLKPRPSGFLGSQFETDNFAPGVSGTDWFEQDRRLGYQKPRMWFPTAPNGELEGPLVPRERSSTKGVTPDDVVKEFQQMKALLSYVSDMILIPYTNKKKKLTRTALGKESLSKDGTQSFKPFRRLTGVLGHGRYEQALEEAMDLWSPLVGAHLPLWAKKKVYDTQVSASQHSTTLIDISNTNSDPNAQYTSSRRLGDTYGERPMPRQPWEPSPEKSPPKTGLNLVPSPSKRRPKTKLEKKVLFTEGVLRSLVEEGNRKRAHTKMTFHEAMNMLNHNDHLSKRSVEKIQGDFTAALADEQDVVQRELEEMNELMRRTVDVQYATLPDRFRLLLEGGEASPRQLTQRMTYLFCRTKCRNWTALAFGVWKALVTIAKSKELYPLYARRAACHLMKEWAISRKFRQMKRQVATWRTHVSHMIFVQRNKAVLPFQTLYRKYRSRCLIMRLHVLGPYKGPLSDIELGEWRESVKFRIPRAIRETRRDIWFGVVKIQTLYRKWIVYRHTLKRRRQVVLLQSVIRMFPKREQFKRLRRHTIRMQAYARRILQYRRYAYMKIKCVIIQKYVRRYIKTLWKWRVFDKAWKITERRMGAALLIQCRFREYKCRMRIRRIIKNRQEREWACLVLQRRWFKKKNAFHTFVLMCCLRAAEKEDENFNRYVWSLGRYYAARVVQRYYAERFFKRNISAAVKIQCRYRGFHGYNLMERLRREKWASRRLHHWARGALRRKDRRVRMLQRTWWRYKKGSLLRHFEYRARLADDAEDAMNLRKKHAAACIIQGCALGKLARNWVKFTKAAMIIQRNSRFFIARLGWRRMMQLRNRAVVKQYVDSIISSMVIRRVRRILDKHSKLAERPQALARGFLLRCKWRRSVEAADKYAKAVLTIQRAYRSSGAMATAVAEVMARKRATDNPFRKCGTVHSLLELCYAKTSSLFSAKDPRAGMTLNTFLYRLGLSYLSDMFPKHEFNTFADLKAANLTMQVLEEMWDELQEKALKKQRQAGVRNARAAPAPSRHFQAILNAIAPKLVPRAPSEIVQAQKLLVYAESTYETPASCAKTIETRFIKKYGLSQSNRGVNLGAKVAMSSWFGYCNFRMLGTVLTPAMVDRCFEDCDAGPTVAPALEKLQHALTPQMLEAEMKWDQKRISVCADTFQLAAEALQSLLVLDFDEDNPDPIYLMLESTMNRVLHYQKRFRNLKQRLIKEGKIHLSERMKHTHEGVEFKWSLEEGSNTHLSAIDSVDLPFNGCKQDFELEMNISVCKLYMELFDKLRTLSSGVQGLKNKMFVYTVRRAIRNARIKRKLDAVMEEYMAEKHDNHVREHWLRFKRIDAVTRKFRQRQAELEEKRKLIDGMLSHILQYGWEERLDDQGYAYYEDVAERGKEPTYEAPRYNYSQWKAISMLQKKTRELLERNRERARLKEEARIREMERIEALWMEEIRKGKRGAKLSLSVKPVDISSMLTRSIASAAARDREAAEAKEREMNEQGKAVSTKKPSKVSSSEKTVDPSLFADGSADVGKSPLKGDPNQMDINGGGDKTASSEKRLDELKPEEKAEMVEDPHAMREEELLLEGHIPWKLRFEKNPVLVPGMWALLRTKIPANADRQKKLNPDWRRKPKPSSAGGSKPTTGASSRRGSVIGSRGEAMGDESSKPSSPEGRNSSRARAKVSQGYGRFSKEHIQAKREEELRKAEQKRREELTKSNPYLVHSQGYAYEPVVIYKFRKIDKRKGSGLENLLLDTRTFRGVRTEGVRASRIFLMNLEVGSKVECRYQKHVAFYPGKITAIHESQDMRNKQYTVCYEDGEMEKKMTRDLMRPPAKEMQRWFFDRDAAMKDARMYARRSQHFSKMRMERLDAVKERAWYAYMNLMDNLPPGFTDADFEPLSDDEEDFNDIAQSSPSADEYFGGDRDMSRATEKEKRIKSGKRGSVSMTQIGAATALKRAQPKGSASLQNRTVSNETKEELPENEAKNKKQEQQRQLRAFERRFDYLMAQDRWLQKHDSAAKISLKFTRLPYRYGWVETWRKKMIKRTKGQKGPDQYETVLIFQNRVTGETQETPPNYRPEHDFSARKLQKNWAIRRARMYLRRLLASEPLEDIVEAAIQRYQKVSYIGYGQEGVTTLMMVRRYGFPEAADIIEDTLKFRRSELDALTLDGLANTPNDLLERLGFTGMEKGKAFKEFAAWYKKTSPIMRDKGAKFFNYYESVDDIRPLTEVLGSGYDFVLAKFAQKFPKSVTRSTAAVKSMVDTNYFPQTEAMLDNFLKRYDKADMAREHISELKNKKTTSTYKDESEAFQILWGATRRLHSLISNLGLGSIRRNIVAAEEQAQRVLTTSERIYQKQMSHGATPASSQGRQGSASGKKRQVCTGPEARAALILRVKVFDYLRQVFKAILLIQRRVRGFNKFSSVNKELTRRRKGILTIQRTMRGCMDRMIAADLREQQQAVWEQLWDSSRELVYYFNRSTSRSTYMEPTEAYRPLVRDRLSQRLLQAWPFLDDERGFGVKTQQAAAIPSGVSEVRPELSVCSVCQVRKCVRLCQDCAQVTNDTLNKQSLHRGRVVPYCFPCFTIAHSSDDTENHRYQDASESMKKDGVLLCASCMELPATRKCLGILDDKQIDDLCSQLQKAVPRKWPEILKSSGVGGERKLSLMLEQISGSSTSMEGGGVASLSIAQLQQVRVLLERTRAECDECYCDECYMGVHSAGNRSSHKWIGFQENAPVCGVCTRSPAEVVCKDCDNFSYCNQCFKVFHGMGRKRKHRHTPLYEQAEFGQDYCQICTRRVATFVCPNVIRAGEEPRCNMRLCNSCHACKHAPTCDPIAADMAAKAAYRQAKAAGAAVDPNVAEEGAEICCICGETADTQCVECGDLYCSNTWMGNPGCWKTHHAKGNRAKHTIVMLEDIKSLSSASAQLPPGGFASWA